NTTAQIPAGFQIVLLLIGVVKVAANHASSARNLTPRLTRLHKLREKSLKQVWMGGRESKIPR
ncbi:MAG: hypothetical protein ACKODM_13930, partial [Cytophagales bacterium]